MKALYVQLTGLPQFKEQELEIIGIIARRPRLWFNAVWACFPYHRESLQPWSSHAGDFLRAVCRIREYGYYHLRWAWPAWNQKPEYVDLPRKATHYAEVLANCAAEARALGASRWGLDLEPYGENSLAEALLKRCEKESWTRNVVQYSSAMGSAAFADETPILLPYGARTPAEWPWTLRIPGDGATESRTYRSHPPDWKVLECTPPPGVEFQLKYWGIHVAPDAVCAADPPDFRRLTVAEAKQWDLQTVRQKSGHPEIEGCWVHIDAEHMADVLRSW